MKAILVINAGSSTIKFAVFSIGDKLRKEFKGIVDRILVKPTFKTESCSTGETFASDIDIQGEKDTYYRQAIEYILSWVLARGFIIVAAGHRVVHGGPKYFAPLVLNDSIIEELSSYNQIMPLHQPFNIKGIQILEQELPQVLQVACFDTGFHVTCDPISQTYALPKRFRDDGIRRYGFHGLSYEYIASQFSICMSSQAASGKFIVAHLGNGSTMAAIKNQKSVATSIGFTGIGGLPMGTRCDSIDPGAVLYMMNKYNLNTDQMLNVFYRESGLLGLSEVSSDMRDLLASDKASAKLAIDVYVQRVVLFAGALAAELQGIDGFVFTGGVGENATAIRSMVGERLRWLGIELDMEKNAKRIIEPTKISAESSSAAVWVIPTDEEIIIANHTRALLDG
ncbi:MAG: acetate/propionate family kinase [Gammaproteobacteria bacterium]